MAVMTPILTDTAIFGKFNFLVHKISTIEEP